MITGADIDCGLQKCCSIVTREVPLGSDKVIPPINVREKAY